MSRTRPSRANGALPSRLCPTASFLLLCVTGQAQQQEPYHPLPGPLHDGGVYHFDTGTWTRGGTAVLGAKVLYDNDAPSGFYGATTGCGALWWTDEGRIPSTTGHAQATADEYDITGFRFAYCTGEVAPHSWGFVHFYERYTPCSNPFTQPLPRITWQGQLPDAGAVPVCWIVGFDLGEVGVRWKGDGEGHFDANPALDDFGFEIALITGHASLTGPVLAGDPNNYPFGDATYYQNESASSGSGLDTLDQLYVIGDDVCESNGCYWFGGYTGGAPFGSLWLQIYGNDHYDGMRFTAYCLANSNSTGLPAAISGSGTGVAAADIRVEASPVPDEPGVFFHADNPIELPFGNGYLCAAGALVRGPTLDVSGGIAGYSYDNSDTRHDLSAFIGRTRCFQYWFRDPTGGGALYNTSNAVSAVVKP